MVKTNECKDVCIKHFLVVGRKKQKEGTEQENKVYKMRIFAKSVVHAKSKFWYYLKKMNKCKLKKSSGEILAVHEIHERNPSRVKTFGIVVAYSSKYGHHTLYKEFRSTSLNGAVSSMCKFFVFSNIVIHIKQRNTKLVLIISLYLLLQIFLLFELLFCYFISLHLYFKFQKFRL